MQWQIEPMTSWPYPDTKGRKYNPFRAKFPDTLKKLASELEHLQVQGAVAVRVVGDDTDVRQDGMLRARAQVRHPGVAISFTSAKLGPLTYPTDAFTGRYYGDVDWQVNLRAIALGLELAEFTGGSRHDGAADLLRRASRVAHPDRGGIPEDWARVDAARQLLKKAQVVA